MQAARIIVTIVAWLIWTGLLLAVANYALVIHLGHDPAPAPSPSTDEGDRQFVTILAYVSFLIGLFVLLGRFLVLRAIYRWKRWLNIDRPGGLTVWFLCCLVFWALAESIAIYGLVIFFSNDDFGVFYAFAIPAVILLILLMPIARDLRIPDPPETGPPGSEGSAS